MARENGVEKIDQVFDVIEFTRPSYLAQLKAITDLFVEPGSRSSTASSSPTSSAFGKGSKDVKMRANSLVDATKKSEWKKYLETVWKLDNERYSQPIKPPKRKQSSSAFVIDEVQTDGGEGVKQLQFTDEFPSVEIRFVTNEDFDRMFELK